MLLLDYDPSSGEYLGSGCAKRAYSLSENVIIKISRSRLTDRQYKYLLAHKDSIHTIPIASSEFRNCMGQEDSSSVVQTISEWVIWEYAKKKKMKHALCPILSYGITSDRRVFTVMPRMYECPEILYRYDKDYTSRRLSKDERKFQVWFRLLSRTEKMFNLRDVTNHHGNYMVTEDLSHCYIVDYGCVVHPLPAI